MRKRQRSWQNVIWREWRNSGDRECSSRLFNLVADEPTGWGVTVTIILLGALYGTVGGLLIGSIIVNWDVRHAPQEWALTWTILQRFVWAGGTLAGVGCLLMRLFVSQRLSWRTWLRWMERVRLTLQISFNYDLGIWLAFVLVWLGGGLLPRMEVWVGKVLPVGLLVGLGVCLLCGGIAYGKPLDMLLIGLFGGLAGVVPVKLLDSPGVVQKNLLLTVHPALVGLLAVSLFILSVMILFILFFDLSEQSDINPLARVPVVVISGLCSVLFDGLCGSLLIGLLVKLRKYLNYDRNYDRDSISSRSWCFWWRSRSSPLALVEALLQACQVQSAVQQIGTKSQHHTGSSNVLIARLMGDSCAAIFADRCALVARGGEEVGPLKIEAENQDSPLRRTATWLLKSIAEDTTFRLKQQAPRLLCPRHLVRCGARSIRLSWWTAFTYYGCRACGNSQELFDWPGKVVAVLDVGMVEEQIQRDGVLWVNWLKRPSLFDFDRVTVVQATDEEVERFAVQVSNDTDTIRRRRYKKMRCEVGPGCELLENTVRLLNSLFERVEHHA